MRDFRKNNESVTIDDEIIGNHIIKHFIDGVMVKDKIFYSVDSFIDVLKFLGYEETE